ncbi:DUF2188 domain-containing protein [Dyadobacter psychrotolerans]|uniref:DUF2188 domain-containing protein n=1 Tax=Dyadobacter psychrotolerans TaxID=2541721 RepID=A0A4R5DQ11_9BACT|nr:DUF2188 domain-containing protein [Dyadobacter psychrotolerans]TDE16349.1 DUF2188 domain-containing protein [Dyadobacter psychrotolerans]
MSKKNQHVVPRGDGWAVVGAGNERATRLVDTQREAINIATDIARNQQSELIVHGSDAKISWRNSYGNDPYPPKG